MKRIFRVSIRDFMDSAANLLLLSLLARRSLTGIGTGLELDTGKRSVSSPPNSIPFGFCSLGGPKNGRIPQLRVEGIIVNRHRDDGTGDEINGPLTVGDERL